MNLQELKKIQRALETFFYKIRFNIALYSLAHSANYIIFKTAVRDALKKQILYFAKVEKVLSIIGVEKTETEKAVKELSDKDLLKNLMRLWVPLTEFIKESEISAYLFWSANKGGQNGLDKLKIDKTFELINESILKEIDKRKEEMIKLIDGTTQSWIARTIEQGIRDRASTFEIAKLLRDASTTHAEERAELIAEQEASLLFGELELEVYKRNGVQYKKLITSRDEMVCPTCMADEEAGEIPIDEPFPSGNLFPPVHYRCRCFVLPVIPKQIKEPWIGQ
jgi:SPP1 gp7 family putative phage head morphogenesis protein